MKIRTAVLTAFATVLLVGNAFACGDSLYRVGKAISYRVYTAPLPGSVLVYGDSESAEQLAQHLAASGHGVRLVRNGDELGTELESGAYDVVIAAYSDHLAVEANTQAGSTTFLPVVETPDEEAQARQEYDRVLFAQKAEIKHYLKAIHETLKKRS